MTEAEFNALAAQGYNRIPVTLETFADLDTPLSIYLKLADSAYTYLMIGNFFSNALVDTLHLAVLGPGLDVYGYTLIDAVCVSPNQAGCELSHGVEEIGREEPYVYPNPAADALVIGNTAGRDGVVLDMLGRRVWSGRVSHDRFAVGVGDWSRSAYVLQVHGTRGVQVVKFVLAE